MARTNRRTIPITEVTTEGFQTLVRTLTPSEHQWVTHQGFSGKPGQVVLLPNQEGAPGRVLSGVSNNGSVYDYSCLATKLAPAWYAFDDSLPPERADLAALGWALALYRFDRYKKFSEGVPKLVWPQSADEAEVRRLIEGMSLGRDLINTPAEDMGPTELADEVSRVAQLHGAQVSVTVGEELLDKGYAAIHMVGRAASDAPRLIDLQWGQASDPKVTLVGKGVCFDSGGLDIKPASGMLLMKKDMGGAAIALGLAHVLMSAGLRIRLRVLIPAVENSVSADAFRPKDIVRTRKGLTVEVGDTDAEGRLILCDALTEASSEKPKVLMDFATLTGAARIALGTELPALFCNSEEVARHMLQAGLDVEDPFWRMPLHQPYRSQLESRVADLSNIGGRFGGAILAALFLQNFVDEDVAWSHVDVMAWNLEAKPGSPLGGEAMGLRASYQALKNMFG